MLTTVLCHAGHAPHLHPQDVATLALIAALTALAGLVRARLVRQ